MIRKQRKKKWILAAALVLVAALIPAEASIPNIPDSRPASPVAKICGEKGMKPESTTATAWGSCTAGSDNCCYGFPEAECESGGFRQK